NELQGVSILEVYNLQLQVLIRRSLDLGYGSNYQGEINMQGKPAGIYFLKLTNPKGLIVKKLIINK
ncbi:MAG: T9SS type A sorting domain-containing protein, partial [Lentimicrobiaceae bacterium]|nr:T9SS type A sorting domain-containing protein [Lentimicrobiaceae bacterium]